MPSSSIGAKSKAAGFRHRLWKALIWTLSILLMLFMLAVSGILFFLSSEIALQQAIAWVQKTVPGTLSVNSIKGNLLGILTIDGFSYSQDELQITIGKLYLRWNPSALFMMQVSISEFSVDQLSLRLPATPAESPPAQPFVGLVLPVGIAVHQASISDFNIFKQEGAPIHIQKIDLSAFASGNQIEIQQFAITAFDSNIQAQGTVKLAPKLPLAINLQWSHHSATGPPIAGSGLVFGDLQRLQISQDFKSPILAKLNLVLNDIEHNPRLQAKLTLNQADLAGLTTSIPGQITGNIQSTGDLNNITVTGSLTVQTPITGALSINLDSKYSNKVFDLKYFTLTNNQGARIALKGNYVLGNNSGQITANLNWQNLQWPMVGNPVSISSSGGKLEIKGTPNNYRYNLKTALGLANFPSLTINGNGIGNLTSLDLEQLALKFDKHGNIINSGKIIWNPELAWDARVQVKNIDIQVLHPELAGNISFLLASAGKLIDNRPQLTANISRLSGKVRGYPLRGAVELSIAESELHLTQLFINSGPNRLQADGRVGKDVAINLEIKAPKLVALWPQLQGALQAQGTVSGTLGTSPLLNAKELKPNISWQAKIKVQRFDPSLLRADFPGSINFTLGTQGNFDNGKVGVDVELQNLSGRLRGYPLAGNGLIHMNAGELAITRLELKSGPNRLFAKGHVGTNLDLILNLKAPNLAILVPELVGNVNMNAKITGPSVTPTLKANIQANNLGYTIADKDRKNKLFLKHLKSDVNVDLSQAKGVIALEINGQDLQVIDHHWSAINLTANGNTTKHQVSFGLISDKAPNTNLVLDAGLDANKSWQGRIQHLELAIPKIASWQLQNPVNFALDSTQQSIQPLCLKSLIVDICGKFTAANNQGWEASVEVTKLNFASFKPWIPEPLDISGYADLDASIKTTPNGKIQGRANLVIPRGRLKTTTPSIPDMEFSGTNLSVGLDAQGGYAKLNLPLVNLGSIQMDIALPNLDLKILDVNKQQILGRIQASIPNLGFLSVISPQISGVQGRFNLDYHLSGLVMQPDIRGQALLERGVVNIPALGLKLENIHFTALGLGSNSLQYQGNTKSGSGNLAISGTTQLNFTTGVSTSANITGTNYLVMNVPEAEVQITPNVTVSYKNNRADVDGEVQVPFARIRPRSLPQTAVVNSKDLIIDNKVEPSQKALNLHAKIRLTLSKMVSFEGFGLRANPSGSLLLVQMPNRPLRGRGRIGIIDGTFKSYGQDLNITHGYAIFSDSPIDNPGLDVQASRTIDEITVGVKVNGTAQQPNVTLFSDPDMSQNDILSYMVTGRPAGKISGNGNLTRDEVASMLLSSGVGHITDELARRIGIDDLKVQTTSTGVESVAAGSYLSPRLYIQYKNSPGTQDSSVRLRYDLNKRFQLQTETGKYQGIDLFYTIER
ncbi:hypothetical protein TI04_05970 [Achromatium sp. WMS2]|nr:hypothetical protein TI04_05970 [Achromatium sp. WMS2]